MIMENPWHKANYTNYFWFMKPALIDRDRTLRGDYFKKPTGYWFTNCEPTYGESYQPTPQKDRKYIGMVSEWRNPDKNKNYAKGSKKKGVCSEERSLMSPDYARNFICDFILGKKTKFWTKEIFFNEGMAE